MKKPKFQYGFYSDALKECYQKFGSIFELPIIKNAYTETCNFYSQGDILDLGAGHQKVLQNIIQPKMRNGKYYSLDNDPKGTFDFQNIDEIEQSRKFSFVVANQFFEHLTIEDSMDIFLKIAKLMQTNAKFIVTVPNISHPNRQISNIDHKTAWGYNSLYMLYKFADLQVLKIARYSKRHPKGIIEKIITRYVSRIYRMDWCDSIIIIGQKNE